MNVSNFADEQLLEIARLDGIDLRVVNGDLLVDDVAGEVAEAEAEEILRRSERLKPFVIISQQDRRDRGMDKYLKPIRIFYANMLRIGLTLRVRDGQLKVGGNTELLTPVIKDEIRKRAEHLIDLLSPEVPQELEPYLYRLLKLDELKDAISVAEIMGISLRTTPVDSGWLIEIMNDRVRKVQK